MTHEPNVAYLTGFTGDSTYLLVTPERDFLLSDPRYTQQLEEESPDIERLIRPPGGSLLKLLDKTLRQAGLHRLAVEADSLSMATYDALQEASPRVAFHRTRGVVENLRQIKDAGEIRLLREAIRIAEKTYAVVRAGWTGELTEQQLAAEIEYRIRGFGGSGCSFDPIVAAGPRSALPHAVPGATRTGSFPFLLLDWGAVYRGYRSDLTRMLVTGKIPPKLERIYGVVLTAQQQAIREIRPGAVIGDVDRVARATIADAGFGKRFGHGLGHGIGLEIHESPRLAPERDQVLKAGMVVTVEPGIYLPGFGGVRIEDDILVTRDGHEVLTHLPSNWESCQLTEP